MKLETKVLVMVVILAALFSVWKQCGAPKPETPKMSGTFIDCKWYATGTNSFEDVMRQMGLVQP